MYRSVNFDSYVTIITIKIENISIVPESPLVPLYGQPLPQPLAAGNYHLISILMVLPFLEYPTSVIIQQVTFIYLFFQIDVY